MKGNFWTFRYPVKGKNAFIRVLAMRPETSPPKGQFVLQGAASLAAGYPGYPASLAFFLPASSNLSYFAFAASTLAFAASFSV